MGDFRSFYHHHFAIGDGALLDPSRSVGEGECRGQSSGWMMDIDGWHGWTWMTWEKRGVCFMGRMLARWFKPWPLWDGYISDPFGKVKWPPTIGGMKRSRLESPGVDVGGRKVVTVREAFNVVVYPSYNLGLQPVLGVDLLSFRLGINVQPTVGWLGLLVLN